MLGGYKLCHYNFILKRGNMRVLSRAEAERPNPKFLGRKVGEFRTDYATLVDVFGSPNIPSEHLDYRMNNEWLFEFRGEFFYIYDWCVGFRASRWDVINWNVGGSTDPTDFISWVRDQIALRALYNVIEHTGYYVRGFGTDDEAKSYEPEYKKAIQKKKEIEQRWQVKN